MIGLLIIRCLAVAGLVALLLGRQRSTLDRIAIATVILSELTVSFYLTAALLGEP